MAGGALASAIVSPVACALDTSALQNFEGRLTQRTKTACARRRRVPASGSRSRPGRDSAHAGGDPELPDPAAGAAPWRRRIGGLPVPAHGECAVRRWCRGPGAGFPRLTWDAIRGRFGPDVRFLNRALGRVFDLVSVDPARLVIGGFSDGATYALSLGLINGQLFRKVAAFSPGFVVTGEPEGKPRVFISHGTHDDVLPIDRCGRVIAQRLRSAATTSPCANSTAAMISRWRSPGTACRGAQKRDTLIAA